MIPGLYIGLRFDLDYKTNDTSSVSGISKKYYLIGAARRYMAQQCQASLPWHCHVATPARSVYLASAPT